MNKIQRRIASVVSTLGIIAGAVFGIAGSAQAVTDTYDCFPAGNKIMSSAGCSDLQHYHPADGAGDGFGRIIWHNDAGAIEIHGIVQDTLANGKGAILRARWYNGNTGGWAYRTFHNTTGAKTSLEQSQFFRTAGRALNNKDEITLFMCDGGSAAAGFQNCEVQHHGPFHRY
jgi:hypothetical protein